jgi:hypothetical protein
MIPVQALSTMPNKQQPNQQQFGIAVHDCESGVIRPSERRCSKQSEQEITDKHGDQRSEKGHCEAVPPRFRTLKPCSEFIEAAQGGKKEDYEQPEKNSAQGKNLDEDRNCHRGDLTDCFKGVHLRSGHSSPNEN